MRPRRRRTALRAARATLASLVVAAIGAGALAFASAAGASPAPTGAALTTVGGADMASHGLVVHYPSKSAPRVPSVPASSYVIANARTGQVLAAKDPHGQYGPASTLKVLTALTLIPRLNPNAMVTASKLAASAVPSKVGLIAGRQYRVSDLFTALLTISANDAAVSLAEATGSLAKGMALINAEARHLQAYDVKAILPNGLPANGQVESAYDEALIARQALNMPAFMKYDSTLTSKFELKPGKSETLVNQNWLLTNYPGGLGGKIGWTVSSEATYVGLARRHGVTLIVTIMHCTPLQEITAAVKLLNWGFSMNGKVKPVGTLVPPLKATTTAAAHGSHVAVAAASPRKAGAGAGQAGFAVTASAVAVAGVGLGGLAWRRRRSMAQRRAS